MAGRPAAMHLGRSDSKNFQVSSIRNLLGCPVKSPSLRQDTARRRYRSMSSLASAPRAERRPDVWSECTKGGLLARRLFEVKRGTVLMLPASSRGRRSSAERRTRRAGLKRGRGTAVVGAITCRGIPKRVSVDSEPVAGKSTRRHSSAESQKGIEIFCLTQVRLHSTPTPLPRHVWRHEPV